MSDSTSQIALLNRRVDRERNARIKSEEILNQKSLELYQANVELQQVNKMLDERVQERTRELEQEKLKAEQQAAINKKAKERFQLAMLGSTSGIWEKNIDENSWYFSDRLCDMLGYNEARLVSSFDGDSLIHPIDQEALRNTVFSHIKHRQVFDVECRILTHLGVYKWFWIVGQAEWDSNNKLVRIAGSISDIDERKESAKLIQKMAHYDHLTQVPNRVLFNQELDSRVEQAHAQVKRLAVLLLDLNDFKLINDTLGHAAGDMLLKHVASKLRLTLGENDLIARLGGDEFAIVLWDIGSEQNLIARCQNLLASVKEPVKFKSSNMLAKISIGIASFPEHGSNRGELLTNADLAMYQAKKSKVKGSQIYLCEKQLIERQEVRSRIAADIYTAIKNKEFYMRFQPFVELHTGKHNMVESLVRWKHSVMGEMSPADFIPIAEESGLIIELGELIIEMVIEMIQKLVNASCMKRLSINISAPHFLSPSFLVVLKAQLEKYPLTADYLCIEITESVLLDNVELARNVIKELHDMGLKVSLDDFGTGYSSLSYLQLLAVDFIKLDRSFIADIDTSKDRRIITESIIKLAHSLKLEVVAEGVENSTQLDYLMDYKCNYIQGNYFYSPMDIDKLMEVLEDSKYMQQWHREYSS